MNKEQLYAMLKRVWPTFYRKLNDFLYFIFTVIREIIRIAISQIKGGRM